MAQRTRIAFLLVTAMFSLGIVAGLSACGDGEGETKAPSLAEAAGLLAREDLGELTEAERGLVESGLREALGRAGAVRVTSAIDQLDFVFDSDGRLAMMRIPGTAESQSPGFETPEVSESQSISVYVGPPARFCDGEGDPELLMVQEYEYAFDEWQVSAKAIRPDEAPFGLLLSRIDLGVAQDAGFSEPEGRRLRGLTLPYPQPQDPEATVTVWVDVEDLLIRRLDVTMSGASGASYPFTFDYDVPIAVEVPPEPAAPDCVAAE